VTCPERCPDGESVAIRASQTTSFVTARDRSAGALIGAGLRTRSRQGFATAHPDASARRTAIGCAFRRRATARRDNPAATSAWAWARRCDAGKGARGGGPGPWPSVGRPRCDPGSGRAQTPRWPPRRGTGAARWAWWCRWIDPAPRDRREEVTQEVVSSGVVFSK